MADIVWFRRDLRLGDHGALAAADGQSVVPLFVMDPVLLASAGGVRRERLFASLRSLDRSIRESGGAGLLVRTGDPAEVLPAVAGEAGAQRVLVSGDYSPYGLRRDRRVAEALSASGVTMSSQDSPYLQPPGTVRKGDGGPFSVFTPYWRVWSGMAVPAPVASSTDFVTDLPTGDPIPSPDPAAVGRVLTDGSVGEVAALTTLAGFADSGAASRYDDDRNRLDMHGTSHLGAALHFGEIHPRTVLAHVGADTAFVRQMCWRDFYADVLFRRPDAAWHNVDRRFDALPWRDDRAQFDTWCAGLTGYPVVDAGMRQLAHSGWMHNRARMIVASFLTKDLLLPWQWGARWFLDHLVDGDVASNSLGWQWCAGTGMDPSPYYRIFNPVLQGERFDPDGDYVRRWVPELAHLSGRAAHTPWDQPDGYAHGYPQRMVDHARARDEALDAYRAVKEAGQRSPA